MKHTRKGTVFCLRVPENECSERRDLNPHSLIAPFHIRLRSDNRPGEG